MLPPLATAVALLKLGAWGSACGKQRSGSWPAPRSSDCTQQVCTEYVIYEEACARTLKGTRQQDAVLNRSGGAASCLMAQRRQMEGVDLGPSRGPSFWPALSSRMMLIHSECSGLCFLTWP